MNYFLIRINGRQIGLGTQHTTSSALLLLKLFENILNCKYEKLVESGRK